MRGADEYGIVSRNAELRTKYGAYAYRAPVCMDASKPRPKPEMTPAAKAIFQEAAEIVARRPAPRVPIGDGNKILLAVSQITGFSTGTLKGTGHTWPVVHARFFTYWLIKQVRPKYSTKALGRLMGTELRPRDHTAVLNGLKRFKALKDTARIQEWMAHPKTAEILAQRVTP